MVTALSLLKPPIIPVQPTCCVLNGGTEFAQDAQELLSLEVECVYNPILNARLSMQLTEPVIHAIQDTISIKANALDHQLLLTMLHQPIFCVLSGETEPV